MNAFDPRVSHVPDDVCAAVKAALRQEQVSFFRPADGTTGRTFIVQSEAGRHVLRLEEHPGTNLKRAIAAVGLAAGASVAVPDILATDDSSSLFWYLEAFVPGRAFPHQGYARKEMRLATVDLGRNLRRLHSVILPHFGLLAPNPWINWSSAIDRYQSAAEKVERALRFAGLDLALVSKVHAAHEYLMKGDAPHACLCKADCRTSNILIADGRVSAIIDWEWATGDLGASDVAAWHFSNEDPQGLDLLLAGYEPDDEREFRRQVAASMVVGVVAEFLVYEEHANFFSKREQISGMNERRVKLLACLAKPGWL